MNDRGVVAGPPGPRTGTTFLLAQLGAHAAQRFAERIAELELTPPQTGLLRCVAQRPGQSQQVIAGQLGTTPSRLVALVDGLQQRGLIERRRNPGDRRHYALHLTDAGRRCMASIGQAVRQHEDALCAGLSAAERAQLQALLARLATGQGLATLAHPGYGSLLL
ncbi:MAG TPA: MarR family transcriptional regulator [Pseudonocardiaceae bacterium]|jgi:DNA-binding MarR family transcriptional regulator